MTNQKLRQAGQAAIDIEPIMKVVAGGKPEFYRMDSSLAFQELPTWHTKIAGLPWNERNNEKVPVIRYGDLFGLRAASKKVKGFNEKTERPRFWGVWLDK